MRRIAMWTAGVVSTAGVISILGLGGILGVTPALASGGTNPEYPGSSLTVTVKGPLQAGKLLTIVASGSNGAGAGDGAPIDYGLDLILTNPAKLPGACQQSESAELNEITDVPDGGALLTYETLNEGVSGAFTIDEPFKPEGTGTLQVCAYSVFVSDDAAWAQTDVKITSASTGRLKLVTRPSVTRAAGTLTCQPGSWSPTPTGYAFRWQLKGSSKVLGHSRRLKLSSAEQGRSVTCTVTARTKTASASATTAAYHVTT